MGTSESRLTQKGQVTIPAAMRERLGLKPRDRVRFEIADDAIVLKSAESAVLAGYGAVTPTARPEDWRAVRETVERGIAEEAREDS